MELRDYLRLARRRIWILIILPVLAAGGVTAVTFMKPLQYSADATIAAPALVGGNNQYTGANGPKAFDSNFGAALTSPAVVDEVAKKTHVSASTVTGGLAVTTLGTSTVGTSTILKVTYTTTDRRTAVPVVRTAAGDTLQFLFRTQVDLAQANLVGAQNTINAAEAALQNFENQTGLVQPDSTYNLLEQEINNLQETQYQDQASGNFLAAAGLSSAISAKQAQLKALAPQVEQYQALVDRKNSALTNLNTVQQTAYQAQDQFASAAPNSAITVANPQRVSRVSGLVAKAGPAAAVGVFLAIFMVFILEVMARRTAPVQLASDASAEAPASPPSGSKGDGDPVGDGRVSTGDGNGSSRVGRRGSETTMPASSGPAKDPSNPVP